jgi:hypothetical protein
MSPSPGDSSLSRQFQIRILKHNQRRLPSQLQQYWFQILTGDFPNNTPHGRGSSEIDFTCSRVCDEGFDHRRGIFAAVLNYIEDTRGETRVAEDLADEVVGSGGEFGGF